MRRSEFPGLAALAAGAALYGFAAFRSERRKQRPAATPHDLLHTTSETEARARDRGRDHGRQAAAPVAIPLRGWRDILWRVWNGVGRDHLGLIAAGVAFYALLALFPALGVAVALTGLVTQPSDFAGILNDISQFFPRAAAEILIDQATAIAGSREGGLGLAAVVGLALAMYSASRGMLSLIEGLNVCYDEREKRGLVTLNLTGLALTIVVILGTLVGLAAAVILPAGLAIYEPGGEGWFGVLRWPILLVGTVFGLAILYRYGPSREHARWVWLSTGAVVACGLWLAGTAAFAFYAGNFARYNETFGTLGGAIVLLMWLWLSAYSVLIGAKLNAEIEAQTAKDSTTGPELPMGARGAVKADTLGLAAE